MSAQGHKLTKIAPTFDFRFAPITGRKSEKFPLSKRDKLRTVPAINRSNDNRQKSWGLVFGVG